MASGLAVPTASAERLRQDALLAGCAFQLSRAFLFYLREIADRVHLKNSGAINSLSELEQLLAQADKCSQDVAELCQLNEQEDSWLWQLQRYARESMQSPVKEREQKSFPQENLINVVNLTAFDEPEPVALTLEMLGFWQEAFRGLVLRQRDTGAEF